MASFLASQSLHRNNFWHRFRLLIVIACSLQLIACSSSKKLYSSPEPNLLSDSNLLYAHVGISIYDPSTNKYLYEHQADKYFIPASNTKLFTCYAAMKHLGDSLVGARIEESWQGIRIYGTGDPTFLLSEFNFQPVFEYLKVQKGHQLQLAETGDFNPYGYGWTWSDYGESYMPERSTFPIYGNVIIFSASNNELHVLPRWFLKNTEYFKDSIKFGVEREMSRNKFFAFGNSKAGNKVVIPFKTGEDLIASGKYVANTIDSLLADTLKIPISFAITRLPSTRAKVIHSQPTDSLLKPMMHRSDNFFAEQTLLMVSNEMTGVMNDAKIIDSLLKTDFKDLPQKPRWVDGSGLSRYNLFSPNDMVHILNKMKNEFAWNRITTILPTGGEGTLSNYYINLKDKIFAKTGTLSNNIALSGYLITKQNKTLIFSVLVNNHMGNTTQIRRAVEKYLTEIVEKN